jgi:hypothetical protein
VATRLLPIVARAKECDMNNDPDLKTSRFNVSVTYDPQALDYRPASRSAADTLRDEIMSNLESLSGVHAVRVEEVR